MKKTTNLVLFFFLFGLIGASAAVFSPEDASLNFRVNNKMYWIEINCQEFRTDIFLRGAEEKNLSLEFGGVNLFPTVALKDSRFIISWVHFKKRNVDLAYYDSLEKKCKMTALSGFHFISKPDIIFNGQGSPIFLFKGNNAENDELFLFELNSGRLINITGTPDHEKIFSFQRENNRLQIETETLYHRYTYQVELDDLEPYLIKKEIILRETEKILPQWDDVSLNTIIAFGDSITCGEMRMNDLEGELHPELAYLARVQEMLEEYGQTHIINLGKTATNTYHAVERMDKDFAPNPAFFCLIVYGTNDVAFFSTASSAENLEWICLNAKNKYGMVPIISTIPPAQLWEPGVQVFKEETEALNLLIIELATRNNIAYIDTYTAFFQHPDGWEACLEDIKGLHPSPLGHEIMADLFEPKILELQPFAPKNISLVSSDSNHITVKWSENLEFDFDHCRIEFGYSPDSLNRITRSDSNYFTFLNFPYNSYLHSEIYFQVQAVDRDGNSSNFSPVFHIDFQQ
ncbi:MAG: hypothetical protein KAT17_00535 [Candidatus Aminicenantes bacterium]|nr:hypothetical protein [Candidatus Aminicenantes bacterium]